MTTEVEFAKTFLHLLNVTGNGNSEIVEFNINNVNKLPKSFNFPNIVNPFIIKDDSDNNDNNNDTTTESTHDIEFTFKSLRQPKFNIIKQLPVSNNTSIFQIKIQLANLLKDELKLIIDPADIKLMLRAKTLNDPELVISSIGDDAKKVTFNVLISKFKEFIESPEPMDIDSQKEVEQAFISDNTWLEIKKLIKNDLKDDLLVNKTIENFKKAIN